MRFLRRRCTAIPARLAHETLGVSGVRVLAADADADDAADRAALRRVVDEAVLLQGLTEDLLEGVRARRSLADLAPPGGALMSRFLELRASLPCPADPALRAAARTVGETLHHHALMISCSLSLLGDLRPERVTDQLDRLDGLGEPARRLDELRAELHVGEPASRA
jgi:hypothetical protein